MSKVPTVVLFIFLGAIVLVGYFFLRGVSPVRSLLGSGGSKVGSGSLGDPHGYPWGMPVYPNSKVELTQVEDGLASVTLTTSDSYDKVVSWYKKEIAANNIGGWGLDKEREEGDPGVDLSYMAGFWDKNKNEGQPNYGLLLIVGNWRADPSVSINYEWESRQNR